MKKRIEIFLYEGVVPLDITGPLEVFSAATVLLERDGHSTQGYEPVFSSIAPGQIKSSSGLTIYADVQTGQSSSDILLIPGGLVAESVSHDPSIIKAVISAAAKSDRLVSVCSGAFILAACGLLDGKRVTTHWMVADRLAEQYPKVSVEADAIYVQDGNIATSGGVTAGIDLALEIVEEDYGASLAMEVARMLLLYRRRPGNQSQFSTPLAMQSKAGNRFSRLIKWIGDNLTQKLTVEQLAEQANMSPRSFARIFPSETGQSPSRFVEQLRIDHARELIESGADSLEIVAQESGFVREERLRRAFQRRLGVTPAQYRAHFIKGDNYEKEYDIRNIHI